MPKTKAPDLTDTHVGARVRMRRMMLGKSQGELAKGLGLSFQQVQKYEKGSNRIGASRLQQIAAILQVEPAFFFENQPGRDGPHGIPDTTQTFLTDRQGVAIVRAWPRVPPHLRAAIVALIEDAAKPVYPTKRAA